MHYHPLNLITEIILNLFHDIPSLHLCDNILDMFKVELKREVVLLYDNHNFWDEMNITKEEHDAIKNLSYNKKILIQNSDKGKSVDVLNRLDYITPMNEMLSDTSEFRNIDIKPGKEIKLCAQLEDRLISFF